MGAWSEDTFGNDTACDWISLFLKKPGLGVVREKINAVLSSGDYLHCSEACECLAAIEVIARLQENWGIRDSYSEDLDQWVEANPSTVPDDLMRAAEAAIERILAPQSELSELWDDGGRSEKWHEAVDDLRERIRKA